MKQIISILTIILLWSCTSKQAIGSSPEPAVEQREVDLLEAFEISKSDSQQLVSSWHKFINNFDAQKGKPFDTIECWSAEAFQNGNYSAPDSISVDACITHLLMPLQKTDAWAILKTADYNVGIQKRQSEAEGRYYISFPRDRGTQDHEMKHTFYFRKRNDTFGFAGYVYN